MRQIFFGYFNGGHLDHYNGGIRLRNPPCSLRPCVVTWSTHQERLKFDTRELKFLFKLWTSYHPPLSTFVTLRRRQLWTFPNSILFGNQILLLSQQSKISALIFAKYFINFYVASVYEYVMQKLLEFHL